MAKNCNNCINSGRPSYEYPCTVCETAYGSAPSKWENAVLFNTDMVEVVRCKDCKYWQESVDGIHKWCPLLMDKETKADDFCSYGERRTDDRETG